MICFNTCIELSPVNVDFTKSMLIGQDFSVMKWMLESGLHHLLLLLTGVCSFFFRHARDRASAISGPIICFNVEFQASQEKYLQ